MLKELSTLFYQDQNDKYVADENKIQAFLYYLNQNMPTKLSAQASTGIGNKKKFSEVFHHSPKAPTSPSTLK